MQKANGKQAEPVQQLAETCTVCGRVRWGDFQPLGRGLWRHRECYAGSSAWLEVQRLKPESERSKLYKFFCS